MSLRKLPEIKAAEVLRNASWEIPNTVESRWSPQIHGAADSDIGTISVYEGIGEQWDGSGVTAKRIAGALRSIGNKDVVVSINSPGGDFFEGVAIYNLLREHPARVTTRVVGLAGSAASIIAMAGDTVEIAKAGFFMIHNAWAVVVGNRHDMSDAIDALSTFDEAMAEVYSDRTGMAANKIAKMMDADTWINGTEAVDMKFADALLPADQVVEEKTASTKAEFALRTIDTALAKQGIPRSQRREMLKEMTVGTQDAALGATQDAGVVAALESLRQFFNKE